MKRRENLNAFRPRPNSYWYQDPSAGRGLIGQIPSPQLAKMLSQRPHLELTGSVTLDGQVAIYNGYHSDCWKATWNGQPVRAKVLRYIGHMADKDKCARFELVRPNAFLGVTLHCPLTMAF